MLCCGGNGDEIKSEAETEETPSEVYCKVDQDGDDNEEELLKSVVE